MLDLKGQINQTDRQTSYIFVHFNKTTFIGRGCLSIGVESGVESIIEILLDFEANMEVFIVC